MTLDYLGLSSRGFLMFAPDLARCLGYSDAPHA